MVQTSCWRSPSCCLPQSSSILNSSRSLSENPIALAYTELSFIDLGSSPSRLGRPEVVSRSSRFAAPEVRWSRPITGDPLPAVFLSFIRFSSVLDSLRFLPKTATAPAYTELSFIDFGSFPSRLGRLEVVSRSS